MSTSILNVWITKLGEPCKITNRPWVVAISHCDGRVLNWSEGRYRHHSDDSWTPIPYHTPPGGVPGFWYESIPTKDGHVEIELPPGCYTVRGTMHSWFSNGLLYGNWATDRAIIQACCGGHVCTTLYAPTKTACSIVLFEYVVPLLMKHDIVKNRNAQAVIKAMKEIFKPDEASEFEQGEFETLRRAFELMGKEQPHQKPTKK